MHHVMGTYWWCGGRVLRMINQSLHGLSGQLHAVAALSLEKSTFIHSIEEWVSRGAMPAN
jgi:hypothetical protein